MHDNIARATEILNAAAVAVGTQRGQQHGEAVGSFTMIGELWRVYLDHADHIRATKGEISRIEAFDVTNMMALMKIARAVYGERTQEDHYMDIAGYAALSGMLANSKTTIRTKHNGMTGEGGDHDIIDEVEREMMEAIDGF